MVEHYRQIHSHDRFSVAEPPAPRWEHSIDSRPSPELVVEVTDMVFKAMTKAGYEPLTAWLEAIIDKAEPEREMLYQQILAGLLRRQAETGVTPDRALANFLKTIEKKKLLPKHVIILFLKSVCDWRNSQIEATFGFTNVRQIKNRAERKVPTLPKKDKSNKKGRSA